MVKLRGAEPEKVVKLSLSEIPEPAKVSLPLGFNKQGAIGSTLSKPPGLGLALDDSLPEDMFPDCSWARVVTANANDDVDKLHHTLQQSLEERGCGLASSLRALSKERAASLALASHFEMAKSDLFGPPPPGFEDPLSQLGGQPTLTSAFLPTRTRGPLTISPPTTGSEWASSVQCLLPFLDKQGVQSALSVLDRAADCLQQCKVIDSLMEKIPAGVVDSGTVMYRSQLQKVRAALTTKQVELLLELHSLPRSNGAVAPQAVSLQDPAVAAAALPTRLPPAAGFPAGQTKEGSPLLSTTPAATNSTSPAPTSKDGRQQAGSAIPQTVPVPVGVPASVPEKQKRSLVTSLQLLENTDATKVFVVRKINKLGFKAPQLLKRHFGNYGPVLRVLLAHSTARKTATTEHHMRRRPSSFGFVEMANPDCVAEILEEEHAINGILLVVQRFERSPPWFCLEDEEECGGLEKNRQISEKSEDTLSTADSFPRQGTANSECSTRSPHSTAAGGSQTSSRESFP
eukprot:TRINITY_DN122291_c0_g1_i1.p1 TRINITY_DN122291_c0_g1~~TRINITY_DN122291_c0_g1_i1.p1  ORF type:complete len:515 (+),score=116.27 TRINITY_DN122291_c0_g1_i1:128-1672(+)